MTPLNFQEPAEKAFSLLGWMAEGGLLLDDYALLVDVIPPRPHMAGDHLKGRLARRHRLIRLGDVWDGQKKGAAREEPPEFGLSLEQMGELL